MIKLERVTKRYGNVIAVDDLSLEISDSCTCVLIGPSGCGKTTTLRLINRLADPDSGTVLVRGVDTRKLKPEDLRRSIGYAIQSVGLFPHLTVGANIGVVPSLLHWDKMRIKNRIEELLQLVGLPSNIYANKYPNELSGGEAQRVGVARALAADPPILLMDEPFGAVDPLTREKLQTEFLHIQRQLKKTIVLVTHDLDEAIRLADRIGVMKAGRIIQFDTPEAILSRPADDFVRGFVGTDRALKRLSRMIVKDFIKPVSSLRVGQAISEVRAAIGKQPSVWVTDEGGQPLGWLDREDAQHGKSIENSMVKINLSEIALNENSTLRVALSRMLGQGFRGLPVVDSAGRLIGEITLSDVEAATAQRES